MVITCCCLIHKLTYINIQYNRYVIEFLHTERIHCYTIFINNLILCMYVVFIMYMYTRRIEIQYNCQKLLIHMFFVTNLHITFIYLQTILWHDLQQQLYKLWFLINLTVQRILYYFCLICSLHCSVHTSQLIVFVVAVWIWVLHILLNIFGKFAACEMSVSHVFMLVTTHVSFSDCLV